VGETVFLDISPDGIAAGHPQRITLPKLVAPSTGAEFNTLQPQLITVGCALVPDHQFEFDSSFILPEAHKAFRRLVRLIKARPDCPLSVFGHADPVGRDAYNKRLSGRRAMAVYAVLIRDVELWEHKLYGQPAGGDRWGNRAIQIMLQALGHDPGPLAEQRNAQTRSAVEAFQREQGLGVDGDPGPITRKRLFQLYMDKLCSDALGQPFKVEKTDFLARGVHAEGKGDYQGCGEFNPVLLFSQQEQDEFTSEANHPMRNEANAPNRRVLVFLFQRGTQVNPQRWPCPLAREGSAGCRKRFWSDGEERRSRLLPDKRRQFQETEDTFACRFYHGIAALSPCEAALKLWVVRLLVDGPNGKRLPVASRRFAVIAGETANAPVLRGYTDEHGILRIPVYSDVVTMTLKLDVSGYLFAPLQGPPADSTNGGPGSTPPPTDAWEGEDKFQQFVLKGGALLPSDTPGPEAGKQRLSNLGYGSGNPSQWEQRTALFAIRAFQRQHGLEPSGAITDETRQKLRQEHGS
jgi:hypothetical protein